MPKSSKTSGAGDASPSATGPAGPLFEGQVGAHYLLTMLAEAEPRGLQGMRIDRVETQRAGEGHPLDDVVVHGTTLGGEPAVLEVQAKRTIPFAPSDLVFKAVAEQLARAVPHLDRSHDRRQFAVATARTTAQIEGPCRDVLRWAREVGDASTFMGRIHRPKVGNEAMRTFVGTLRSHLERFGAPHDDETLWHILRRFQILSFDFDAVGSQAHELARERARALLDAADAALAGELWSNLISRSLSTAADGGDRDAARLRA